MGLTATRFPNRYDVISMHYKLPMHKHISVCVFKSQDISPTLPI